MTLLQMRVMLGACALGLLGFAIRDCGADALAGLSAGIALTLALR